MIEDAIAVVGAGCRLPGAPDLAAFWRNLRAGVDTLTRFEPDELLAVGWSPEVVHDPNFVPVAGVLPGGDEFAWRYFGYSLAEARTIDPQQRVFLEVCLAALQDAGIDPRRFPGLIGVYGGCDIAAPVAGDTELLGRVLASDKDFLATRVAYKLGLRGPAVTVQTACSTSLVAVHQACQSLRAFECDAALAGGSSLGLPQAGGYLYHEGHVHSRDGRCRPFDAGATGIVPSNGAGAVVLRRLEDALTDGDRIMAVLRGSALNNDGGEKIGYTAPSLTGQRDVIALALGQAQVDPADVVHVEGHGTATPVGDPVEVAALTAAYREHTDRTGYCALGSVKSNIGHTSATAGVAGLIKTALMLEHRELVPTVHFKEPNPALELDSSPFRVITANEALSPERPALAAVSAFGVGGTNAHAVLETAPIRPAAGRGPRVFCLSAPSAAALRTARTELADRLVEDPPDPVSAAWTLLAGRFALPYRLAVPATDPDRAIAELRDDTPGRFSPADEPAVVGFVVPGHGTLYPGAAAAAHRWLPRFREIFDEATDLARRRWDVDLSVAVRPDADEAATHASTVQQLGVFALGYALGSQLLDWGIRPAAVLGQSLGEYVAAALAGVWDLAGGLEVVAERALAIERVPAGRMITVYAEADEIAPLLADRELAVATEGPGYLVVAGGTDAVERLRQELTRTGVDCAPVVAPTAGHTERMRPVGAAVAAALGRVAQRPARLPVVSNLTGALADPDRMTDPGYWADQMCGTVRLTPGMGTLLGTGATVLIELGPGQSMVGGLRRHPDWTARHLGVSLLGRAAQPREEALSRALGSLWTAGLPVPWESLFTERPVRCSLPPVPLDAEPLDGTGAPAPAPQPRPRPGTVRASTGSVADDLARLWCAALGVPAARPEDNFFALGGESLGLVRLLTAVRRRTGAPIPVAELAPNATFGELQRLAHDRGTGEPQPGTAVDSPNLLPLHAPDAPGTPLFLTASGAGSTLCYQHLAPLLGDRPVYGLESPGLHDAAPPARRVEELAEANLALLRQIQPTGPYLLGGWSFGAMLAHELASRLLAAGEPVGPLVYIDGFPPWTGGTLPIGVRPGHLTGGLRLLSALRGNGSGGHLRATLALGAASGIDHRAVFRASVGAMLRYIPRPVDAAAVILKTGLTERVRRRVVRQVAPLYLRGVRIVGVPGDHFSVLDAGRSATLADHVREVVSAADGEGRNR